MTAKKPAPKKAAAKKTAAKKTAAKKAAAKKTAAKKTAAKKTAAKKTAAKRTSAETARPRPSEIRMAAPRASPIQIAPLPRPPIRMAPTRTPAEVPAAPAPATVRPASPPAAQRTPTRVATPAASPVPPTTSLTPARSGRRRRRVAVDALVCVALLVVAARAYSVEDPAEPPPQATVARVAFAPPSSVPAPGELVRTQVLTSGDLRVDHWIRSRTPITTLTATLPRVAGLAETGPVARAVRLDADGVRVSGPSEIRLRTSYRFPTRVTRVHVRYLLSGVTSRSGSVIGRALARLTALDLFYAADERPKEVVVFGGEVRSLACTANASTATPLACGTQEPGNWRVLLTPARRHQTVMAQVDLT